MIKIGLVSGTKQYNGLSFCEIFNGYDRDKTVKNNWGALC